ncbi:protein-disulfide reductase DsbD [Enterovirga sp. CN4-39]|uniref:protein-disulfide reductase DsbD n=1 Tax=Enterovirga sp. CN4-39 TaxID=3400910 RepID=UPI003C0EED84
MLADYRKLVCAAMAAVAAVLFAGPGAAEAANGPRPAFDLRVAREADGGLRLRWSIAPGNYLYREKIAATTEAGAPLPLSTAPGEIKDDPNFGPVEVHYGRAEAALAAADARPFPVVRVVYQGCSEQGICFPPVTREIDLATLAISPPLRAAPAPDLSAAGENPGRSSGAPETPLLSGALLPMLAAFLGIGLLLSFTPCVFPMIPILSGLLARSAGGASRWGGFRLSAVYGLAMAAAYATLGIFAGWIGGNLQILLQTPVAIVTMSAVLVALALSSFGVFELRVPPVLAGSAGGKSRLGPMAGAAALGFGSALIVGPCVTPPLAAALLYVANSGDVARGAAALFALGLGMGLPLVAFGTFGARVLPKSGPWLAAVNKVFGVAFLGMAAWMLSRILSPASSLALWAGLAIAVGIWMGALRWPRANNSAPNLSRIAGRVVTAYGLLLLVGAISGRGDPLHPITALIGSPASEASAEHTIVTSVASFERALGESRGAGKPILVEFSADWCTACKDIEREVLGAPAVQARLADVTVIKADVTRTNADTQQLMERFGVVGPPTLLFLRPQDGTEIPAARTTGAVPAEDFLRKLSLAGA